MIQLRKFSNIRIIKQLIKRVTKQVDIELIIELLTQSDISINILKILNFVLKSTYYTDSIIG